MCFRSNLINLISNDTNMVFSIYKTVKKMKLLDDHRVTLKAPKIEIAEFANSVEQDEAAHFELPRFGSTLFAL